MSDLIDRQAAIDFVDAGHLVNPNEPRWSDNEVVNFLKSRPSAQPDIIRCPDCYYNDGTAYCELHFRNVKAKDFCSWAERRE